jgi:hypothetical protein
VTAIELTVDEDAYYLDVLAHELGVPDAGHVLMTRYNSCSFYYFELWLLKA